MSFGGIQGARRSYRMAVGAGCIAVMVSVTLPSPTCGGAEIELLTKGSYYTDGVAWFSQYGAHKSGTFTPFLAFNSASVQKGYNSSVALTETGMTVSSYSSLSVSGIPSTVIYGTRYNTFAFGTAEPDKRISIDTLELWVAPTADLSYTALMTGSGTQLYNLDDPTLSGTVQNNTLLLATNLGQSSGDSDIDFEIFFPASLLTPHADKYLYVYSEMGGYGTVDSVYYGSGVGERFFLYNLGDTPYTGPIPEPGSLAALLACVTLLGCRKRRPAA